MQYPFAGNVMDDLITELADRFGPCERVIQEHFGSIEHPAPDGGIDERAAAAVQDLRRAWGPTADPHWVEDIVPGRGRQQAGAEFDCYFALFRRDGFWGYVRIRVPETDTPQNAYKRLVFGVVRDKK